MPLRPKVRGEVGTVYSFIRDNDRCPVDIFLENCQKDYQNKFKGSFETFTKLGAEYENRERFTPLHRDGRPLWEFKEHGHRIYAVREVFVVGNGTNEKNIAVAVLLSGWKKGKEGKATKEEKIQIASAITLYNEYASTGGRTADGKHEPLGTATERAHRNRR